MSLARRVALVVCAVLLLGGASAHGEALEDWPAITLVRFAGGFVVPTSITHAGDDSGRLFVTEQPGRIRIIKNDVVLPTPMLDIRQRVGCCGERGLLGLAFPPLYPGRAYFYVNYTNTSGHTVISRFHLLPGNPNQADAASEEILLTIAQPYANHNGGQIGFGPADGYLYIATGDGGAGNDPHNFGQRTDTLLGKILRIDVESGLEPYAIPPTNPFTQTTTHRPEIWALGLRNPWRFAFDPLTADLYIADVGQNRYEEVNFQPATSPGGENYGWRLMEGSHCHIPTDCDPTGLALPVAEYGRADGCSVTGGYVHRDAAEPGLEGIYFFGDFCTGRIWGLRQQQGAWRQALLHRAPVGISTFGQDAAGQLFLADYQRGDIYRIEESQVLWLPLLLVSAGQIGEV